jgi:hypothetical protein
MLEEAASTFAIVSARHDRNPTDARQIALSLAGESDPTKIESHSRSLISKGGALGIHRDRIALTLPAAKEEGTEIECLHRNSATLIAYLQNLMEIASSGGVDRLHPVSNFRSLALNVLTKFQQRTEIEDAGVYKSRAGEVWLKHRNFSS